MEDMITLKQLTYALAVEKTLHFKKAADLCNVSQSALSTAINEFEKQLDITIFERNTKHVLITHKGQLILDSARKINAELDVLLKIPKMDNQPFSSEMTIGIIPTIGPYLLPKVLPALREKHPHFKMKIIEEQSHLLVSKVKTGEIDAAIIALPYPVDGLISFEFWKEDFYLVCHKDDTIKQPKEIKTSDLELGKLMLLKDGHCLKEHVYAACQFEGNKGKSDFDSAGLHTLIQMVAGKIGTTFVPQMALDQLIYNESELSAIHLNEPGPHRRIAFIVRPNYVRTTELTMLMDIFTKELTKKCGKQ
ncbi:LysR substrate-binding domain-containing protein [Colwellia sp. MSW7]|uniref:LysR substrate-binding domain-containing protein n=1 Tax=Colwellia maritima TaxID=2912588 RepID=A0ABS9X136_9GAMM|nr:hydrogen peroxide-inducible genes activator [Colwellia maritima]MCI2282782.1 LysR substrate-binding domain-containing protein [Colwellia maritima]